MICKKCGEDFAWFEGNGGFNGWEFCRECEDIKVTPENMKVYMEHLKKVDDKVEKAIQKEIDGR